MSKCALVLVYLFGLSTTVLADNAEEVVQRCMKCHGESGRSDKSDVPSIGGFSEFAIMDLMESYRAGYRKARTYRLPDGTEDDMASITQSLTDTQIQTAARYFSEQTWEPHIQEFDQRLARRGAQIHDIKCAKCHSERGSVAEDDLALTSGQWREYLAQEFEDFDDGSRRMADKMKQKYDTLSADDKRALLELYVSGGNL